MLYEIPNDAQMETQGICIHLRQRNCNESEVGDGQTNLAITNHESTAKLISAKVTKFYFQVCLNPSEGLRKYLPVGDGGSWMDLSNVIIQKFRKLKPGASRLALGWTISSLNSLTTYFVPVNQSAACTPTVCQHLQLH